MQKTQLQFLGWEDPLEKEMETHSSILALEIPWTEEPGGLQSMGSQRVGHDWLNITHMTLTARTCKSWQSQKLFSCPAVFDSSQPHGLQHARPPCPSPSPGVCPSSCPLLRWCHPAISSSVTLFSFCLQSFSATGYFPSHKSYPMRNLERTDG